MGLFDRIKERLNPKTIAEEAFTTLTDRVIPSGADELGKAIFTGHGYIPWPAKGQEIEDGVHGKEQAQESASQETPGMDGEVLSPERTQGQEQQINHTIEGDWHAGEYASPGIEQTRQIEGHSH